MIPKHHDPQLSRTALAPYNFVPLPEKILIPDGMNDDADLSGEITIALTNETDLYIRCGVKPEQVNPESPMDNPHRQEFFHHGNPERPVIPGSSFRGMLRSLVEIISFSRMAPGFFSDHKLIYRGVGDTTKLGDTFRKQMLGPDKNPGVDPMSFEYPSPLLKGGYLTIRNGRHYIMPAREFEGESFVHVEYADAERENFVRDRQQFHKVFVRPAKRREEPNRGHASVTLNLAKTDQIATKQKDGLQPAVLVISGHMDGASHPKHMHCAIFAADEKAGLIEIDLEMWERYEEDSKLPRGRRPTRKIAKNGEPLFYLMADDKLVFFGPTMLFRLPYQQSVADLISSEDNDPNAPDFAQLLFGRVIDGQQGSCIRSRVRVGDLICEEEDKTRLFHEGNGRKHPKILSGPKPTSFQMYLTQKSDAKDGLHFWDSAPEDTALRGFKRYWLKKKPDPFAANEDVKRHEKQYTKIRPIKPGNRFRGKIRFSGLSKTELGALLVALEPGSAFRHQIGMGKPLGMGAVKVTVEDLLVFEPRNRYRRMFDAAGNLENGARNDVADLKKQSREAFEDMIIKHFQTVEQHFNKQFWHIRRLADLKTMMDWDNPVRAEKAVYVSIGKEGQKRQWRERFVLPSPEGVLCPPSPKPQHGSKWREATNQPYGAGSSNRQTVSPPSRPSEPTPPKKSPLIEKGQTPTGVLSQTETGDWTVIFQDDKRPVRLSFLNKEIEKGARDGMTATFTILEANKRGISARLDKI